MVENYRFLISERVFNSLLINYKVFLYEISHIKHSKYDSTTGIKKISNMFTNWGGVRLSIGTTTFNAVLFCYVYSYHRKIHVLPNLLPNAISLGHQVAPIG